MTMPSLLKLWILEARQDLSGDNNPWYPPSDKMHAVIVRAESEDAARKIAALAGRGEIDKRADAWTNAVYSTCKELTGYGLHGMIMARYSEE